MQDFHGPWNAHQHSVQVLDHSHQFIRAEGRKQVSNLFPLVRRVGAVLFEDLLHGIREAFLFQAGLLAFLEHARLG